MSFPAFEIRKPGKEYNSLLGWYESLMHGAIPKVHVHLHKWRHLYCFYHKPQSEYQHAVLLTEWMNACLEETTIAILGAKDAHLIFGGPVVKNYLPSETFAREWVLALHKAMNHRDCFVLFLEAERIIGQLEAEAYAQQLEQDKTFISQVLDTINKSDGTYAHKMMHEIFQAYSMLKKGHHNQFTIVYLAVVCLVVFCALYIIPFVNGGRITHAHVHSETVKRELC